MTPTTPVYNGSKRPTSDVDFRLHISKVYLPPHPPHLRPEQNRGTSLKTSRIEEGYGGQSKHLKGNYQVVVDSSNLVVYNGINKRRGTMRVKEFDARKASSIPLPPSLRGGTLFVTEGRNTLIVKRQLPPNFQYVRQRLRKLRNKISKYEIEQAIAVVRAR